MSNTKLVSIIVPVYNAEGYLEKCIQSVRNQSYRNIELILVNDGSTDNSNIICERHVQEDSRILYFEQKNAGPSAARNVGIKKSSGQYIQFLDADDYLSNDSVKILVEAINNCDLVIAGYLKLKLGLKGTSKQLITSSHEGLFNKNDLMSFWSELVNDEVFHFTWNKLYKKDLIQDNIQFNERVKVSEDMIFNIDYLSTAKKIRVISKPVCYHILYNQDSITKKYHYGLFEMRKTTHQYIEEFLLSEKAYTGTNYSNVKRLYAKRINSVLQHLMSTDTQINVAEKKKIISDIINDESVRDTLKFFDVSFLLKTVSYSIKYRKTYLIYFIYKMRYVLWKIVCNYKYRKLD